MKDKKASIQAIDELTPVITRYRAGSGTPNETIPTRPDNRAHVLSSEPEISLPQGYSKQIESQALFAIAANYLRYYAAGTGHTARAKRYDLSYFLEHLAGVTFGSESEVERVSVNDWTMQRTKDFVDARLARGESPATVSRRLATIKHFGRTLAERVPGYLNPAREVKTPVADPIRPQSLSDEEVSILRQVAVDVCENARGDFIALRNRFLLEVLLATGLRADEVRLLCLSQVSPDLEWLKNVKTKGRKYRNVYLASSIRSVVGLYLEERELAIVNRFPAFSSLTESEKAKFPVLVSLRSAQLDNPRSFGMAPKSIWRIIARFGHLAVHASGGKASGLHPHLLRHTFAHGLLDSSKDIRLVAQALGHSDVRVTMRYTERTYENIARAVEDNVQKKDKSS